LRRRLFRTSAQPGRHSGTAWKRSTKEKFLAALRILQHSASAAASVKQTLEQARAERRRDPIFAAAWDAILDPRISALEDAMLTRALNGTAEPVFYHGKQSADWLRYNDTLGMWMLSRHLPARYGRVPTRSPAPGGSSPTPRDMTETAAPAARAPTVRDVERRLDGVAGRLDAPGGPQKEPEGPTPTGEC
jgi:hypothetical protein